MSKPLLCYWGVIQMILEWVPIIVQTAILLVAIVVAFMRSVARQAVSESRLSDLRADHVKLAGKVDGISRSVARIEGSMSKKGAA